MGNNEILYLQLEGYIRLVEMAEKQILFLQEERLDSFMGVWTQRKKLQSQISDLQKKAPLTKDSEIIWKIQKIQAKLKQADDKMRKIIAEKKDNLQHEFQKLKLGQKALRGYARRESPSSRFIAKKG